VSALLVHTSFPHFDFYFKTTDKNICVVVFFFCSKCLRQDLYFTQQAEIYSIQESGHAFNALGLVRLSPRVLGMGGWCDVLSATIALSCDYYYIYLAVNFSAFGAACHEQMGLCQCHRQMHLHLGAALAFTCRTTTSLDSIKHSYRSRAGSEGAF